MKTKTIALTAAGSALLAPLATATAADAANAPSTTTPTAASKPCAATAAVARQTHLNATSVGPVAGGGRSYVYDLGTQQLRFALPPAGFNAVKATSAQLATYGLPPRPAGAAALAQWTKLMSH